MGDRYGHESSPTPALASRPPATYPVQHDGWDDIDAGDVTGDGRTDIVGHVRPRVLVAECQRPPRRSPTGRSAPRPSTRLAATELTQGIGVGDVTGDGRSDVVASYGGSSPTGRLGVFGAVAGGHAVGARRPAYQS